MKIGYLPITDATPLLVARAMQTLQAEGLRGQTHVWSATWADRQAFVAGADATMIHLLSRPPWGALQYFP